MQRSLIFNAWGLFALVAITLWGTEAAAGGAQGGPSAALTGEMGYSTGLETMSSATSDTVARSTAISLEADFTKEALKGTLRFTRDFATSFVEHILELHEAGVQAATDEIYDIGTKATLNIASGTIFGVGAGTVYGMYNDVQTMQEIAKTTDILDAGLMASNEITIKAATVGGPLATIAAAYYTGVANQAGEFYGEVIHEITR